MHTINDDVESSPTTANEMEQAHILRSKWCTISSTCWKILLLIITSSILVAELVHEQVSYLQPYTPSKPLKVSNVLSHLNTLLVYQDSIAATSNTKYLSTYLNGGLANERIKLRNAAILARLSNRVLIIPSTIRTRRIMAVNHQDNAPDSGWFDISIACVFDIPYLAVCASKHGVKLHLNRQPNVEHKGNTDSCPYLHNSVDNNVIVPVPTYSISRVTAVSQLIQDNNVQQIPHILANDTFMFPNEVPLSMAMEQVIMDGCITWSPLVLELATVIANCAYKARNIPISQSIAVHARVENDMLDPFAQHNGDGTTDYTAISTRMTDKILTCMDNVLPRGSGDASKDLMLLFTGEPKDSVKLKPLFAAYGNIMAMTEDFAKGMLDQFRNAYGLNTLAAIHYALAVDAKIYVGYSGSTYSQQVVRERVARGRISYLYNDIGVTTPACSQITDPIHLRFSTGDIRMY